MERGHGYGSARYVADVAWILADAMVPTLQLGTSSTGMPQIRNPIPQYHMHAGGMGCHACMHACVAPPFDNAPNSYKCEQCT